MVTVQAEQLKNDFKVAGLNSMCLDCSCLFKDCKDADNPVYTGCVYKKVDNC